MHLPQEYKVVLFGPLGVGKSTTIAAISDIAPIKTEVQNSETQLHAKSHTTAAMDYGECTLPGGDKLRLYGSPGQLRYAFMWPILAKGAMGALVLIDNSRPDPLLDLDTYLGAVLGHVPNGGIVVGITRTDTHPEPSLDAFAERLAARSIVLPIIAVDIRQRADVLLLMEVLLNTLEAEQLLR